MPAGRVTSVKRSVRRPSGDTVRSLRNRRQVGRPRFRLRRGAALDEEDVEVAVVVVVEQRDAGAHHLGQVVLAGRAVDVREHEARRGGRLDEERFGGRRRRRRTAANRAQRDRGRRRRPGVAGTSICGPSFQPRQVALDRRGELELPMLERKLPRVGRPLDALVAVAGPHVRGRQAQTGSAALRRRAARSSFSSSTIASAGRPSASSMRPRLKRASRNVGWLSTAWRYAASAASISTLALEDLAEVVVRRARAAD